MRILRSVVLIVALLFPSSALAARCHHHHHHRHHPTCSAHHRRHHHTRCRGPRRTRHATLAPAAATASSTTPATPEIATPAPLPVYTEVGNVPACVYGPTDPAPYLAQYHATVMRVIVTEFYGTENPLACIQTAVSEGFRVHVALQWSNHDSPAQVAAFVGSEMQALGPYSWAVTLGNEQELDQPDVSATPRQYADDWQAAEPVVRQFAPNAILVAGDISPWGFPWLKQAWADGLPDAQALGAHPYAVGPNGFTPSAVVDWGSSVGLPTWFDEALSGPHAWGIGADIPAQQMAGAQLAGAWWDGTRL